MKIKLKEINAEEMISKDVRPSGNGAAVWVPRRWLGKKVVVILCKKR